MKRMTVKSEYKKSPYSKFNIEIISCLHRRNAGSEACHYLGSLHWYLINGGVCLSLYTLLVRQIYVIILQEIVYLNNREQ